MEQVSSMLTHSLNNFFSFTECKLKTKMVIWFSNLNSVDQLVRNRII